MLHLKSKYLFTSALIHFALVLMLIANISSNNKVQENNANDQDANINIDIIEINEGQGQERTPVNPDKFYWGIGIDSTETFENNLQYGTILVVYIKVIKHGYSAETSGLEVNDKIFLVNGKPIYGDNDIKGDEPRELELTISRNGIIINIRLPRVKVYY